MKERGSLEIGAVSKEWDPAGRWLDYWICVGCYLRKEKEKQVRELRARGRGLMERAETEGKTSRFY